MSKKYITGIIIIVFLAAILIVAYNNIKPSVTKDDIVVEAVMKINDTSNNTHKDYIMDVSIVKNKDSHIVVYPYVTGIGIMTYSTEEKEGYFVPSSIGSDGATMPVAIKELRNNNLIEDGMDISLVGFWFPDEAGQYKTRIYLEKLDDFERIESPVVVCVYKEKKLGKMLTWAKVVPVTAVD